ncbi:MAG: metal ABC transporter permease [Deltaproteobacteria bacterium]|nr:metal ABC transporter permease [Deltaproteobacteria bacterium]
MIKRVFYYLLFTIVLLAAFSYFRIADAKTFLSNFFLFRDPLIGGMVAGLVVAYLGVYMLFNRIVFMSLAVTQGAGLGIFLALLVGAWLGLEHMNAWISLGSGIGLALLISLSFGFYRRQRHLSDESMIGILYVLASSLIVLVGDRISEGRHEIDNLLFGNAVAVTTHYLWVLVIGAGLLLLVHLLFYRQFLYCSADPEFMQTQGVKVGLWRALLYLTLTVGITLAVKLLGSLTIVALIVIPPFIGLRRGKNAASAFVIASLLGLVCPAVGFYLSYLFSLPAGASVVSVCGLYLLLSLLEDKFR